MSNLRAQVKTGRGTVDAQRVASTPNLSLPETSSVFRRALDLLYCKPPMSAGDFGAQMWPDGKGRIACHGGGDYAAQMLLGRLRRKGWARVANYDGSSLWKLTSKGNRMCRPVGGDS